MSMLLSSRTYFCASLLVGSFLASSAAAQPGVPFDALQQRITALNNTVIELQAALAAQAARVDSLTRGTAQSVFVRWGNGTAPAGTTLVQTGLAFSGHYSHSGSGTPVCLNNGGPTSSVGSDDILYAAGTAGSSMPPGIQGARQLKCAVALAEGPTTVVWGSSAAPVGWSVVYSGYGFGAHYTLPNPLGRICVDSVNFDASLSSPPYGALYYPTSVLLAAPQGALKCAVIVKGP